MATVIKPMTDLLRKGKKFRWESQEQESFNKIKELIGERIQRSIPDFNLPFILRTDASDYGISGVLSQLINDEEQIIMFASKSLTDTQRAYSTPEKECLAILWALEKYREYVEGHDFTLYTDNSSLVWLHKMKNSSRKLMRWAIKLQEFSPKVVHIPGKMNVIADSLSRAPVVDNSISEEDLEKIPYCFSIQTDETKYISLDRIRKEQATDPGIIKLELDGLPDEYTKKSGIVYRIFGKREVILIPKSLELEVMRIHHDLPEMGHSGGEKTYKRIIKVAYWKGMKEKILNYVKT